MRFEGPDEAVDLEPGGGFSPVIILLVGPWIRPYISYP